MSSGERSDFPVLRLEAARSVLDCGSRGRCEVSNGIAAGVGLADSCLDSSV